MIAIAYFGLKQLRWLRVEMLNIVFFFFSSSMSMRLQSFHRMGEFTHAECNIHSFE